MSPHFSRLGAPAKGTRAESDLIRAILVDDERLMREHLRRHLVNHPDLEIVGEADSVAAAWELISEVHPEVVFLDVQMAPEEGFALLPLLANLETLPSVVFVTAFDNFAIRAFEANALDYLTKPVMPERLMQTLEKVRRERMLLRLIGENPPMARALGSDEKASPATAPSPTLDNRRKLGPEDLVMLSEKPAIRMIRTREISAVESQGNYTLFYLDGDKTVLMNRTLHHWEERLPGELFLKANRSLLVNAKLISQIVKITREEYQVFFKDLSKPISVSRLTMERIKERVPRL
jgi:two-component system LytT family response regulator